MTVCTKREEQRRRRKKGMDEVREAEGRRESERACQKLSSQVRDLHSSGHLGFILQQRMEGGDTKGTESACSSAVLLVSVILNRFLSPSFRHRGS